MRPNDVAKFVEHLAAHPILGPRYGNLTEFLPLTIRDALAVGEDVTNLFIIFEVFQGSSTRFLGGKLGGFVADDFVREVKTTPYFWIGPELVKRITSGKSPLLSYKEIRDQNSTVGLNLVIWDFTVHPRDLTSAEVGRIVMIAFDETYGGYQLREVIDQASCLEHLSALRRGDGLYYDRVEGCYGNVPEVNAANFSDEPRNVGMTRDLALTRVGSRFGSFLLCSLPQFGFARAEQRLLLEAMAGKTDEELGARLGISLAAVKKTWRVIYDRAAEHLPELAPGEPRVDGEKARRGKQKRQRLLDYLRQHREELRPVSRKLLKHHAP